MSHTPSQERAMRDQEHAAARHALTLLVDGLAAVVARSDTDVVDLTLSLARRQEGQLVEATDGESFHTLIHTLCDQWALAVITMAERVARPQQAELFTMEPVPVPDRPVPAKVSPDAARTARQRDAIAAGWHPLSNMVGGGLRLHPEAAPVDDRTAPGRRCGNCWFRRTLPAGKRAYPKCTYPGDLGADEIERDGYPRASHGPASDTRGWWPACRDHTYGDPSWPDAARWPGVPDA